MNPLAFLFGLFRKEPWDYEVREPILWTEAEEENPAPLPESLFKVAGEGEECPACPWRCPECNSEMTQALHDGWECLVCGIVY